MDKIPVKTAQQLPRAVSNLSRNLCSGKRLEKHCNRSKNRQYPSHSNHQQNGVSKICASRQSGKRNLELLHKQTDHNYCIPYSGKSEYNCRPCIQNFPRQFGLETKTSSFQINTEKTRSSKNRPLCKCLEQAADKLLLLDPTTRSPGCRCSATEMASIGKLCLSPFLSNTDNTKESQKRRSENFTYYPNMVQPTMVPITAESELSTSKTPTQIRKADYRLKRRTSSSADTKNFPTSRLEYIRRQARSDGISKASANIIAQGTRNSTQKTYQHAWKNWISWNIKQQSNPYDTTIANVVQYLTDLFHKGLQVNSINIHRSALSGTLPYIDGCPVGQHKLVVQLFNGMYNIRPKKHKNTPNWKVDIVLNEICNWGRNSEISINLLTKKLAILLALTSAARVSELCNLKRSNIKKTPHGYLFLLDTHKKNRRASTLPGTLFFPFFQEDENLCPCKCIQEYINRTSTEPYPYSDFLFRAINKPHGNITTSTLSNWIKNTIIKATGENAKTHDTRGKAASKSLLLGNLTIQEVIKAAEWKSEDIFTQHYYFADHNKEFGLSVLKRT